MARRGLGDTQIKANARAKQKILDALDTGEYLRYNEIQEKTGLSTATLSKHLKELEKGIVERLEDLASKEYPIPVRYRLNPSLALQDGIYGVLKKESIAEKEGISDYVEYLNHQMGLRLLANVKLYFDKNKNEVAFEQAVDNYNLKVYREYACVLKEKLNELSNKGVDVQPLIAEAENEMKDYFDVLAKQALKESRSIMWLPR